MRNDMRGQRDFQVVEDFYRGVFAPGAAHVTMIDECVSSADGTAVYVTGLAFRGDLLDGPSPGIYRCRLSDGELSPVTGGPARLPRPAPDGRRIAGVTEDGQGRQQELFIGEPDGTVISTHRFGGLIEQLEWSPSGSELLLLVAGAGADLAGYQGGYATSVAQQGPSWLPTVETDAEAFRWRRLWVLDTSSGEARCLSREATNVWEACWAGPDRVAAVCSDHHGEGSWYRADLRFIDRGDGREMVAYTPRDQIGLVVGSGDGKRVAFVEAVCSDRGIVCGTLMVHDGNAASEVATGAVEVTHLAWRDNDVLHLAGHEGFDTVVADFDFQHARMTERWRSRDATCGAWYPAAWPVGRSGSVFVTEAYGQAPALVEAGSSGCRTVRSFAAPGAAEAMAGRGRIAPVEWKARDGLDIHGWLVTPDAGTGPMPLVLDIHGGPIWANRNRWMARCRATPLLVRLGCAVLYPNPRGSSTRGQDFARLVRGDMGGADATDLSAALDHFIGTGLADAGRLACTGTSYGGFMSCWLVTQEPRIAAAAPISPVTDWYSQHRTSQIPFFDAMFLEDSPTNPDGAFFHRSPVMFTGQARAPSLLMAGALDKNTPPTQAREFHQSLIEAGVESALVTYPQDGHSLRGYPAYIDSAARIVDWFRRHLALPE